MKFRTQVGFVAAGIALVSFGCFVAGCASTDSAPSGRQSRNAAQAQKAETRASAASESPPKMNEATAEAVATQAPVRPGPPSVTQPSVDISKSRITSSETGKIDFNIANVGGERLAARVKLQDLDGRKLKTIDVPDGIATADVPAGTWSAFVSVLDQGIPILVDIHVVTVEANGRRPVMVRLLEGASGNRRLAEFDTDLDGALDRLELEVGTDPNDAASIPGYRAIEWPSPVLSKKGQWYVGDLHVHSKYGIGKESVGALVRRAERAGLDFLAITDRNTMQAAFDPEFRSDSVVLIPAMEWGNDEKGVGLVFAPKTLPDTPSTISEAQLLVYRVQSQGGLFFIAHPCFSTAPWQWGLSYVNGVETWCRPWNVVPPLWLDRLDPPMLERQEGELIHSVALAAGTRGYSANGQATWFYDHELTRGLKAAAIGGSYSVGPEVPLGRPLTYVFANEKSLEGILDGLRWGRTFISADKNGPKIAFMADTLIDEDIDTGVGGFVPLNVPTRFRVEVEDAEGKVLQVLLNGRVFRSTNITWSGDFAYEFDFVPENYAVFRVRIVEEARPDAFGVYEMLAMTSPIYALEVVPEIPEIGDNIWLNIDHSLYRPGPSDQFFPGNPATDEVRTITPRHKY